jgi:hypothetical protein
MVSRLVSYGCELGCVTMNTSIGLPVLYDSVQHKTIVNTPGVIKEGARFKTRSRIEQCDSEELHHFLPAHSNGALVNSGQFAVPL